MAWNRCRFDQYRVRGGGDQRQDVEEERIMRIGILILSSSSSSVPISRPKPNPSNLFSVAHRPSISFKWVANCRNPSISILQPIRSSPSSNPSSSCNGESQNSYASSRIFIKGLSRSTSEGVLVKIFSTFGDIRKVKVITSKGSKESLGLAYIWFAHEEDALSSVKEMDGKFVDGRFIAVMMARPEGPSKQVRALPYKFR
ncbi:glycine-rich RNA-binding protein 4, mitochondrial-like [Asparagus officinalis]|uniref:glycine-rich RNA-binding protein 4, mitochondrial-like n=1 Tax=Asparagus officinalis TaxID=4686 RepID=UPI00098DF03C|nr:glycine-rich RNA-binding protein 4, mitochondrial-like [Asparagus officinalis]